MKTISALVAFLVGAFAIFSIAKVPAVSCRPPTNSATVVFANLFRALGRSLHRDIAIFFVRTKIAADRLFGFNAPIFGIGIVANMDEQILKSLGDLDTRLKKIDDLEKMVGKNKDDYDAIGKLVEQVKIDLDNTRKLQLGMQKHVARRAGEVVSQDCAAYLGGIMLATGIQQGRFSGKTLDFAEAEVKNLLGIHAKAALTTSDIPLPTLYSGDIVELVYQYGQGRKNATVFPMGAVTVKLPKLGTDTDFGLITSSGTVTEVSPSFSFVTLTAEKFGGLIRLPSEIDEDSIVSMGQFLARYSARKIAKVEDVQVFTSTGADSGANGAGPGLITAATTDGCKYSLSGATTGGKTSISQAVLADFRALRGLSTLSGIVLGAAKYYMHPTFEALLVTFNTSATVTPYMRAANGQPATLDGFPIEWVNVMPVYTASAVVSTGYVLFGDASYQYLGVRNGIRFDTSREAGFATDEILVRALERLTVGLMASKAVAVLLTDAS